MSNQPLTRDELLASIHAKHEKEFQESKQRAAVERERYRGTRAESTWSETQAGRDMVRNCKMQLATELGVNPRSVQADGTEVHKLVNQAYRSAQGRKELFYSFANNTMGRHLDAYEKHNTLADIAHVARATQSQASDLASPEEALALRRSRGRCM